jgi:hypothetical protein
MFSPVGLTVDTMVKWTITGGICHHSIMLMKLNMDHEMKV